MTEPASSSSTPLTSSELDRLVMTLPEGVLAIDDQDRIWLCNPSAARMLGLPPGRRPLPGLLESTQHPELYRACLLPMLPGSNSFTRQIAFDSSGRKHLLELTVQQLHVQPGSRICRVVCIRDAADIARSERIKADFVANASHELRTPLSTMRAAIETLLEAADRFDAHQLRFLEVLAKNVDRLEELARDLLELARVESPNLLLQPETIDLPALVAEIRHDFDLALRRKQVSFETDLQQTHLTADRRLIKRAISNLVDNAVKFVAPAAGKIVIRSGAAQRIVMLEVEDNGIGIPVQDRDRIFERFYQVDKSRREGGEAGSGLGLAIVKHVMLAMGGAVQLDPTHQQGTRIQLLLPQLT